MKLISELGGSRVYEMDDGTIREVRAEARGTKLITGKTAVDQFPELGEKMAEMAIETLRRQVAGYEVIPDSETVRTEVELQYHYLEDEDGNPLEDEDGEWIVDPDQEPTELLAYYVECGVWGKVLP